MDPDLYKIQYPDINVTARHYDKFGPGVLLITKIFMTIQGEGPFAGYPAVFVRLAGCNRGDKTTGCDFCDTDFRYHQGMLMEFEHIISKVKELADPTKTNLVVITGGEPMMQDNLTPFVERLSDIYHFRVQIESNGDRLARGFDKLDKARVHLVVSPKIVVSKNTYRELDTEVFRAASSLKFLLDVRSNSPYHLPPAYVTRWHDFSLHPRGSIFCSPVTVYKKAVAEGGVATMWDPDLVDLPTTSMNYAYAAACALEQGWRFSHQSHLFMAVE